LIGSLKTLGSNNSHIINNWQLLRHISGMRRTDPKVNKWEICITAQTSKYFRPLPLHFGYPLSKTKTKPDPKKGWHNDTCIKMRKVGFLAQGQTWGIHTVPNNQTNTSRTRQGINTGWGAKEFLSILYCFQLFVGSRALIWYWWECTRNP